MTPEQEAAIQKWRDYFDKKTRVVKVAPEPEDAPAPQFGPVSPRVKF